MDVEPQPLGEHVVRDDRARTRPRRRSARRGRGRARAARARGPGSRVAAPSSLAGERASLRPRPAGASGRVRSAADLVSRGKAFQDVGAERRGRGDRDRSASTRAENGLRPERRERRSSRLVVRAIDDQHAVEVVELVLDDARRRRLELELHRLALRVDALDRDRRRALDGNEHVAEREAPLVVELGLARALS